MLIISLCSVALRVNGKTLVSAQSGQENGRNSVSQNAMAHLKVGDVVQLEVLQGKIFEPARKDLAFASFSGWLLTPELAPSDGFGPPRWRQPPGSGGHEQCCCRVCQDPPTRPPYLYTTPRPYSSTIPPYYPTRYPTTLPAPIPTRTPRIPDNCCSSLLVSSGRRRTLDVQQEKFGVYRIYEVKADDGRAVFKHCENDIYIYYYKSRSGWSGWLIGPQVESDRAGIILESNEICVEQDFTERWKYYNVHDKNFVRDETISVTCFTNDGSDGRDLHGKDDQYDHYHLHEHYHHHKGEKARSAGHTYDSYGRVIPAYKIKSNPDVVEATFLFPNRKSSSNNLTLPFADFSSLDAWQKEASKDQDEALIVEAARKSDEGRNGIVSRRRSDNGDEIQFA